ncbi:MAG: hypothetical protein CSB13_02445 [Chloroflexi bacterium]|nr:MAG: hypothetical protein CSB13_02445 [Chloroflexota bacterium]
MKRNLLKKPILHIAIITLILLISGWYLASFKSFFTVDTGLRFMQIRQLVEQDWRTFAIDYPQQVLDPNLEHVPYYYAYSVIDGEIYLDVSHIYPLLVSFFFSVMGTMGLPIVAVAGGLLTAVAIYKLSQLTKLPHPEWLLWITIFATPIVFYSLALWDHTLAAACAAWAVYGMSKSMIQKRWQPAFWAGIFAGFGLAQRPEMYLFTLVLGLSILIFAWRSWRLVLSFVISGVLSTCFVWVLQYLWVGHPFGLAFAPHFFGYGTPDQYIVTANSFSPLYKYTFLLFYVEPGIMLTFVATLLILVGTILIVFSLRLANLRKPVWLLAGGMACVVGYGLLMYWSRYGIIPGIISTFPLIALSLTFIDEENGRYTKIHRFVSLVTFLFLGGMLLVWPSYGGRQWGARYLLVAYPLLAFLAFYTYSTVSTKLDTQMKKTLQYVTAALLITSILMQFMGVRALYIVKIDKAKQQKLVASLEPDIFVTDKTQAHLPPAMSPLTDKLFLQTGNDENREALFNHLQAENVQQFGYITLAENDKPPFPAGTCYVLDEEQSLPQCGGSSSCWIYQLSANCGQ